MPHDLGSQPQADLLRHSPARQRRLASFIFGFVVGLVVNLAVIVGLLYLKVRDTSSNPWETLSLSTLGAIICISPTQLTVSGALAVIRQTRPVAAGLVAAVALGLVALIILFAWSGGQADAYGRSHHHP